MNEVIYWYSHSLEGEYPFHVSLAGRTDGDNYLMERSRSATFVAAYVKTGYGFLTYEDKDYRLSPGDVFLLHAHSRHRYGGDKQNPFTFLWCNISGVLISYLLNAYELGDVNVISDPGALQLFEELHQICRENTDANIVDAQCAVKFHEIVASAAQRVKEEVQTESLAQKIKHLIDSNLKRYLTVHEVAERLGYSEAHINRVFKAAYGEPPYHYMLRTKLVSAQKLLQGTDLRVKQVAELFGFNDEFHFSNAFFKQFGYRPKQVERRKIPE